MRRGFTIIELVITITVMGILLTLAVVNLMGTQVSARDTERKTDIESLQLELEGFYKDAGGLSSNIGRYPSTALTDGTVDFMKQVLLDVDTKVLMAPGISDPKLTFISATNNIQTTAGVTPQPTINQYVYQPIDVSGVLCTLGSMDCRKYNLFYRLEADNTVYTVTSKNQ